MSNLKIFNNKLEKAYKELEKKYDGSVVDIKVNAYYSEDKTASLTPAKFTYKNGDI